MARQHSGLPRVHLPRPAVAFVAFLIAIAAALTTTAAAHADEQVSVAPAVADPVVTRPVSGGAGAPQLYGTTFDLSQVGYQQSEYFMAGTADSYQPVNPLTADGRWTVAPASTAPYTTRVVVDRPKDPAKFNGTVVVEWLNVTAGVDVATTWIQAHNELIREGYAWVGVSAQAAGVNAVKAIDPARYSALSHPGDSYSYDIFSQAGQAVRDSAASVLSGLRPRTLLAVGESQSAFRLTTYTDAVQPFAGVYDGILLESRGAVAPVTAPLSQAPQADVPVPDGLLIRTDLKVPVLTFETETDLLMLGYLAARQPDSARFRLWEVAGTSHADTYITPVGPTDTGDGQGDVAAFNTLLDPPSTPDPSHPEVSCNTPINAGQAHYVLEAAVHALNRWATTGVAPVPAPRLEVDTSSSTPEFVLDANGNVKGGIRTPSVDTPVATLSGFGQEGSFYCTLFGTTVPFGAARLAQLYPTHAQFVARWSASTGSAVAAGHIRPADGLALVKAAAGSSVGG
ncbi:alpha/beta hydrolase domain-containing protein [Streptomyces sp. NPDC057257]|uniref:alpha/beta hydrolase domain-containing protein n=1 Tax=Streptomyces sp. NPDC057257 TaxID=3346071 RepID=UPI00363348DB